MKKLLVAFILIIIPVFAHAQLSGNGTFASAYNGTFQGDLQWNFSNFPGGKVYINGDIIIDNELLTIEAGMSIIFITESADLIINGTGQLNASGTSGSEITFTADDDNDGTYGEAGERWGHISYENSTGNSAIDFCIIEFGLKTGAGIDGYGGGLQANTGNLTISNSLFRKNTAIFGGGVFIGKTRSTPVTNCVFDDNRASYAGGGLYFWDGSSSTISNCIISNNQVTASYKTYLSGGGLAAISSTSIKVINCTFVNNASNATDGKSICFYGGGSPSVINSIFWGSSNQYYPATPSAALTQYCAVQGATYPSCINLSSGNSDPAGPHFNNPAGSDWSIKVISPCRDAGTTPSPTVLTDYAGNSRIDAYDIGAYEVQYNGWKTTATNSTWADDTNWDLGTPNSAENVVIRSGASSYPTNSASQDFTIGSGYGLVLDPGAKATFGTLTKTGDLKLRSNSTGISSLITNNSVSAIIELFLTGGGGSNYKWHYISSPVSALPVSTFAPALTLNFAQFIEPRPVLDILQGWVAYDGYLYMAGGAGTPPNIEGTNLVVGQGYNYYRATDYNVSFSGTINIADVPKTITFGGNASLNGFNLLGNPFSSGLNWDYIVDPLFPARYPANTSKGLYFTRNNVQCSYIAGVGYPDASVTGVIPPMQGFFIKTTNTSTTLNLPSAARAHNSAARYKGSEIIPLVRVELADDTLRDNTVVRFDTKADAGYDNDFDALRISLNDAETYMYSSVSGVKYSINGQPFPETFTEYPLVVNITTSGNHTLSTSQLQGLDNYGVYLIDKSTGFTADLKTTPVLTFIASPGLISDRFVLKVSNILTATEELKDNKGGFNIYPANNLINIQTISEEWDGKTGSVKVFDLAGKTTSDLQNTEFNRNSLTQVEAPEAKGLYVVEIRSGVKRWLGKVVIR